MNASELIELLEKLIDKYGDLKVSTKEIFEFEQENFLFFTGVFNVKFLSQVKVRENDNIRIMDTFCVI